MRQGYDNDNGKNIAVPFDPEAFDALRARLMAATASSRLPEDIRTDLVEELTHKLDMRRRWRDALRATDGALGKRGRVLAGMTAHDAEAARVERLMRLLGLDAPPAGGKLPEPEPESHEDIIAAVRAETAARLAARNPAPGVPPVDSLRRGSASDAGDMVPAPVIGVAHVD